MKSISHLATLSIHSINKNSEIVINDTIFQQWTQMLSGLFWFITE